MSHYSGIGQIRLFGLRLRKRSLSPELVSVHLPVCAQQQLVQSVAVRPVACPTNAYAKEHTGVTGAEIMPLDRFLQSINQFGHFIGVSLYDCDKLVARISAHKVGAANLSDQQMSNLLEDFVT